MSRQKECAGCYRVMRVSQMCYYAPTEVRYCPDCFDYYTPDREEIEKSSTFRNVYRRGDCRDVLPAK